MVAWAEGQHEGRLCRAFHAGTGQLEPAGEHRVDDDEVALQLEAQELAASGDARELLSAERGQRGRGSPDGERRGRLGSLDRTAGEGGVEGLRNDRQVRQLRHRPLIVAMECPC